MHNKILFCATVDDHFESFHLPYLRWFKEQGWEVHVAANGNLDLPFVDKKYNIPIQRSPYNKRNIKAYKKLKKLIADHRYKLIHCHTPMGGVLTRLAARKQRKYGTKVIYTAHGFHFCKGAPALNWLLYYPIERFLSRYTDCLITINHEDYQLAKKHKFKMKSIKYVHGIGVNTEVFKPVDDTGRNSLRRTYGYSETDFLLFYAAEFNENKNQQLLLETMALLQADLPNAKLLLAGDGPLFEKCKELAVNLGVEKMVDFLGFRSDIEALLKMCNVAVASSLREGLPVNIMEAMACGLPVIATENRGHNELILHNKNGWIVRNCPIEFSETIKFAARNKELIKELGQRGRKEILEKYCINKVLKEKSQIYRSFMNEKEGILWQAH